MGEFFGSVWWLIVTLGLLVTFHEFGHFWVARRCGVRVLRFSIGFGRALWTRRGRDGTEYVVAAIPLGGYVKMLDEREGDVPADAVGEAFNRKPIGQRIAIVAAGPVFNLIFAVAAFWAMFVVGKPDYQPLVGRAEGLAAEAGFARGDRLVAIDGEAVATWSDATLHFARAAIDRSTLDIAVLSADGGERVRRLDFAGFDGNAESASLPRIGLIPKQFLLEPVIGKVRPDTPAARAGLAAGDRVLTLDGVAIASWDELPRLLQERGSADRPVNVSVARGAERLAFDIVPESTQLDDGRRVLVLGVEARTASADYDALLRHGPLAAIPAAFAETWRMTRETLALLKRMVLGEASLKNLSGPISIAQYANTSAQLGAGWFLFFLAVMSLSIAIMNLLPIPILDGGHLLYYLIELVKGSPVSERALIAGQYVGLAMLAGLMGLAFYNDILRLIS